MEDEAAGGSIPSVIPREHTVPSHTYGLLNPSPTLDKPPGSTENSRGMRHAYIMPTARFMGCIFSVYLLYCSLQQILVHGPATPAQLLSSLPYLCTVNGFSAAQRGRLLLDDCTVYPAHEVEELCELSKNLSAAQAPATRYTSCFNMPLVHDC